MPVGRARITIDLTPELRRELKTAAAQADMTMREFVTESVRRAMASDAPATDGTRQRLASAAPVAAVNEAQQRAIRQLTDPVREQLVHLG